MLIILCCHILLTSHNIGYYNRAMLFLKNVLFCFIFLLHRVALLILHLHSEEKKKKKDPKMKLRQYLRWNRFCI